MTDRVFTAEQTKKLEQIINEGIQVTSEIETLTGGLNDTVKAVAEEIGAGRVVHPAPGQPADHRVRREARRRADGARVPDRAALRQHVVGHRPGRAGRGAPPRGRPPPRTAGVRHSSPT